MALNGRTSKGHDLGGAHHVALCAALAVSLGLFSTHAAAQTSAPKPAAAGQSSKVHKSTGPQAGQQTFSSAGEASHALFIAVKNNDLTVLLNILGPNAKDIISSGDDTEDRHHRAEFAQKYQQMHRLVNEPDGTTTLYVGAENWPTPIPLVHQGSAWYFDTAAGKEEILYRRIGRNELAVIQVCHELVDAQKEYYAQPHDGDSDKRYAQRIFSDPGKHNGLYWQPVSGEAESPIGPLVAEATAEGYVRDPDHKPQPFQGYFFRILKATTANAGFIFVAYPAEYRSSGVMTFLVNQDGIVYEKDLGLKTAEIAKSLMRYERDSSWRKAD